MIEFRKFYPKLILGLAVLMATLLLLGDDRQVVSALVQEPTSVTWRFEFLRQWFSQPPLGVFNHQPTGMTFDASGNLYVVDRGNRRVQVLDRQGQAIRALGTLGDGPGQFWFPLNVVVDSQGVVYVTDQYANRVVRFASDGTPLPSWEGFEAPTGIGVGSDGSVYVSDHPGLPPNDRGRLFKLSPDGASRTLIAEVNGGFWSLKVKRELGEDVVYIVAARQTVQKYSGRGGLTLTQWSNLDLRNPFDVEVDRLGNLYVTSRNDNSLVVYSRGQVQRWLGFHTPEGVILGPDNLLYVSDGEGGNYGVEGRSTQMRIQRFTLQGQLVDTWGSEEGHAPGQMVSPDHVAWDPAGFVWVHDNANGRFIQFTPEGELVRETPRSAQFRSLVAMQLDNDGTIWVSGLCQLYALAHTGEILHVYPGSDPICISASVNPHINFTNPRGFVFDHSHNFYVADPTNHRVVKLDLSGQLAKVYGSVDTLNGPEDVALDETGDRLYVLDIRRVPIGGVIYTSTRIQVYRLSDGTLEDTWIVPNTDPERPLDGSLIVHIEVDQEGYVYAADGLVGTIWKLERTKGEVVARIEPGGRGVGAGQFDQLVQWNTFALDPQGNVYTVELWNGRVQVFAQVSSPALTTATPSLSPTAPFATPTPTSSPTTTFTPSPTSIATNQPIRTATLFPTPTPTTTPTATATSTITIPSTETPTASPTSPATLTPTATATGTSPERTYALFLPYVMR